jgi:tRNA (adenine22-N1)-methyltransferase
MAIQEMIADLHCDVLADIGTDHGYTPIAACLAGSVQKALACDNSVGSLRKAVDNIQMLALEDKIDFRLCDGVSSIMPGEADLFVFAGMGAQLIGQLIRKGRHVIKMARYVIVAPHKGAAGMRKMIHSLDMRIVDEKLVYEADHYYPILLCENGSENAYTEAEYFFGKILLERKDPMARKMVLENLLKAENILNHLMPQERAAEIQTQIQTIKEVLSCW